LVPERLFHKAEKQYDVFIDVRIVSVIDPCMKIGFLLLVPYEFTHPFLVHPIQLVTTGAGL
jgi:hypothetical protein